MLGWALKRKVFISAKYLILANVDDVSSTGMENIGEVKTMEKAIQTEIGPEAQGKFYTLFIDDKEYRVHKSELTGAEIMDLGGIPHELGLILIQEDGTQVQVREDEVIDLKPGRRFKKAPRFKRG